ncbi:hypothetical protein Q7C_2612 [Methylophaga frappieri]|uniref:Uncharacterized protein n=1 Tax=Methylophaga frappieri (strain ATCC BAA-2434 / DSM 25690 / JAM7) TaxID=754477 RepID=I1YLE0_METFJ|nr:hypothetical protein [Methylophaga frappieri]AFJ03733.1 hypothetical protein Q7C_2612 [Methylophaga frappieri]
MRHSPSECEYTIGERGENGGNITLSANTLKVISWQNDDAKALEANGGRAYSGYSGVFPINSSIRGLSKKTLNSFHHDLLDERSAFDALNTFCEIDYGEAAPTYAPYSRMAKLRDVIQITPHNFKKTEPHYQKVVSNDAELVQARYNIGAINLQEGNSITPLLYAEELQKTINDAGVPSYRLTPGSIRAPIFPSSNTDIADKGDGGTIHLKIDTFYVEGVQVSAAEWIKGHTSTLPGGQTSPQILAVFDALSEQKLQQKRCLQWMRIVKH